MGAVLALDLGNRTGWALRLPDGRKHHGHVDFHRGGHERDGAPFLRFRAWLIEQHSKVQAAGGEISLVVFERLDFIPRKNGYKSAFSWGAYWGALTAWCEHHGFAYLPVAAATLKKSATGSGRATKGDIIAALQAAGFQVTDDNEADAIALLEYGLKVQEKANG
jgi:hypothetical protein